MGPMRYPYGVMNRNGMAIFTALVLMKIVQLPRLQRCHFCVVTNQSSDGKE